jgi:hypothetical protein
MQTLSIQMTEDYCCGGGHCGELPGYTFHCPLCSTDSFCRTGKPLNKTERFKCLRCKTVMEILDISGDLFKVSLPEGVKS